jgi:transcriptional regulator with XRE-family HTH domain
MEQLKATSMRAVGSKMVNDKRHWTESSLSDFIYRIGSDFISQIEMKLEEGSLTQKSLAIQLKVSEGSVSQVLKSPGNLQLDTMVKYARACGMKMSVLLYDDGDKENKRGPIHPDIFRMCWEFSGRPSDFFALPARQLAAFAVTGETAMTAEEDGMFYLRNNRSVNIATKIKPSVRFGGSCATTASQR